MTHGLLRSLGRGAATLAALVMTIWLGGCAEYWIKKQAQDQAAAGQWPQAIATLDAGVRANPESAPLRSGLVQLRSQALTGRLAAVAEARSAGKLDEAQAQLNLARVIDPGNTRVEALMSELATQSRQDDALVDAQ